MEEAFAPTTIASCSFLSAAAKVAAGCALLATAANLARPAVVGLTTQHGA